MLTKLTRTPNLDSLSENLGEALLRKIIDTKSCPVFNIDLFVTEECNLACPYCFVHGKKSRYLDELTGKAAIDFLLKESKANKHCEVFFMGGEPLLCFPLIVELVQYGRKKAKESGKTIGFHITTNGTLIDENKMQFFRAYGIPILLSLDGDKETHDSNRKFKDGSGTFEVIKAKTPIIKQYQPWLGVRMTPNPDTCMRLVSDVWALFSLGANQYIIGPASGVIWPEEALKVYFREMLKVADWYVDAKFCGKPVRINQFGLDSDDERLGNKANIWGCGAGRGRISVTVDGKLQGCAKVQGLNNLNGLLNFGDVWNGFTEYGLRIAFATDALHLRKPCWNCELKNECIGGCPAVNVEDTGSPFLPNPMECKFTKIGAKLKAYVAQKALERIEIIRKKAT